MSKSTHRSSRADDPRAQPPPPEGEGRTNDLPARRDTPDQGGLLDRILNTPHLAHVVPRLRPELLHRIILRCGLEDCGELVALATPEQLARVFDLDLWRAAQPGRDEQFDAGRFGVWIETLLESGAVEAARKLAEMDVEFVIAGLAQHALVYDRAAAEPYTTTDGEQVSGIRAVEEGLTSDVGGYLLKARRPDSWDAIIDVLMALGAERPDYFHRVMCGCRTLSNSGFEVDGLHDLLPDGNQVMFDLASDREQRRESQGFVAPAQARTFLQMSRELQLGSDAMPPANPIARAYFRAFEEATATEDAQDDAHGTAGLLAAGSDEPPAPEETAEAVSAVYDVLLEAGILTPEPRALLSGSEGPAPRLERIEACLQFALDRDQAVYSARRQELAYLANTLMAGCSIQSRPFTAQEASDAAVAVCNLGLENWPPHWLPAGATEPPDSFLLDHDLVSAFQIGWTILHRDVSMYAAEQLIKVLTRLQCDDREIQAELDTLRGRLARHRRAGAPWLARDALDVIAILDIPAWITLLALIDECPVIHAALGASHDSRTHTVNPADFEFISENSHLASVREFMLSLPETLRR